MSASLAHKQAASQPFISFVGDQRDGSTYLPYWAQTVVSPSKTPKIKEEHTWFMKNNKA